MHGSKHSASESDSSKQSSSEQVSSDKRTSTMKRKLSLQKMMNTLKLDSPSKSSEPPAHLLEEEDVFSEGDISDEEEEEGAGSFRLKHSLDSSGNSPRFSTGLTWETNHRSERPSVNIAGKCYIVLIWSGSVVFYTCQRAALYSMPDSRSFWWPFRWFFLM